MNHQNRLASNRFSRGLWHTPLVQVQLDEGAPAIWCKLEFLNPSGSTKDRIARYMLEKAWRQGRISHGSRVIEASSGSTSIALALHCAQFGLKFTAVMPEGVSNERVMIIRAYGGDIVLIPKEEGIVGAIRHAEKLATECGAFLTRQFENEDNPEAHRVSTAQEILSQLPESCVDAVVSGVGTGGTLVGLYQGVAESGCDVIPVMAKPVTTGGGGRDYFHAECCSFSARIPGVVDGLSKLYDPARLPGLVELEVSDSLALETTRKLIRKGFPVGPSSGLNYAAAVMISAQLPADAVIVTVFPDRMERYFSTELFKEMDQPATAAVPL
jgi:cysteine synthase A